MGKMKDLYVDGKDRSGADRWNRGGHRYLTVADLLATEKLVGDVGHQEAAKRLGVGYPTVRQRMRKLEKLRLEADETN